MVLFMITYETLCKYLAPGTDVYLVSSNGEIFHDYAGSEAEAYIRYSVCNIRAISVDTVIVTVI